MASYCLGAPEKRDVGGVEWFLSLSVVVMVLIWV